MNTRKIRSILGAVLWVGCAGSALAQSTNSADIRGTVTDASGALLPDVTVTVLNVATGVSKEITTNKDGLYDTSSIVVGTYSVSFEKPGFSKFVRSSITAEVGFTQVNAELKVGAVTEQIVVNTDLPLLQTESGEQSTTLEAKKMAELPNVGQNWENFTILLPGTAGTASASLGATPGQSVAANGNLPYNAVLADGATSTLSHSANADVSVFETVQELQVSTSSFSAQYGIGGLIYNQISKGGTNRFHGSLYEYWQNDALNARSYFQKAAPFLRYNNFGGSVGGPILRNKMFFYFNYDKTINNGSAFGFINVPTVKMRNGDFSEFKAGSIGDPATTRTGTDSSGKTIIIRDAFAGNQINSARFDSVAKAIQGYYPLPNVAGSPLTSNYYFQVLSPNPFVKFFGRFDYDVNKTNRITASVTQRDNAALGPGQGICPINCNTFDIDSTNAQISDVWNISSRTINEVRMGYTKQLNFFAASSFNQGYPAKIGLQFSKADTFPTVNVTNIQQLGPGTNATYKEHIFDPSDVVTMIRGKHILHFGGEYLIYEDNSTAWGNINGATVGYTGTYTASAASGGNAAIPGLAYADFLLGQTQNWSASVRPEYAGRQKSPQIFIQDDFKIRPNLTLNLGLRYQIQQGWSDAKKNQRTFDPTIPNAASGNLGAMWFPNNNGRSSLQATVWDTFLPRLGFSYQVHPDTVIRGGWGIYAYGWSLDTYGSGQGDAFGSSGSKTDNTNGLTPVVLLSGSGSALPYVAASTSPTAFNGQGVNYNQYHTPVAKIYQWNAAVEKQIGNDMSFAVAYVASHGFNLAFPVDINQIPESKLAVDDIARGSRPFTQYQGISGSTNNAISNYNSLQLTVQKRLTHGLSVDANYVWSHFLDDIDSSGWGSRAGTQTYQRSYDPSANYGASNFDIRNAFKGIVVYQLPFGKGAMFLNNNSIVDAVIGGWRASGTWVVQSGVPYTVVVGGANNSYSQAGQWYPNLVGNPNPSNRSIKQWYDPTAFAVPAAATFGTMRRNSLYGPSFKLFNMSLAKSFHIWEQMALQVRVDANNVFNHPSFNQPARSFNQAGAGQITSTVNGGGGRFMQLGARFSF